MTATWKGSPNFTPGRTQPVSKIVIHWMAGTLAATDATFDNPASEVSAHFGVENGTVHQYVKSTDTAWHAKQANPFSIGIEHSAAPGRNATAETLETSAQLLAELAKTHGLEISATTILPHNAYVATACPGTIPIAKLIDRANQIKGGDMAEYFGSEEELYWTYKTVTLGMEPTPKWLKDTMEAQKHGATYKSITEELKEWFIKSGLYAQRLALLEAGLSSQVQVVDRQSALDYVTKNLK